MLHGENPKSIKITGASKGSILLDFVAYYAFARAMLSIMNQALQAVERIQKIRLQQAQIQELNLKNDAVEKALEEEIEQERQQKIEIITKAVMNDIESMSSVRGDKENALRKSIERLVEFIEKGGHVDFVVPQKIEGEDIEDEEGIDSTSFENTELTEIRNLAEQVRHLENKSLIQKELCDLAAPARGSAACDSLWL